MNAIKANKIKCLFGHHEYSVPTKKGKQFLCAHCERAGHVTFHNGMETWYEYNEDGFLTRLSNSQGYQESYKYDKEARIMTRTLNSGAIRCYAYNIHGKLVKYIPRLQLEKLHNVK